MQTMAIQTESSGQLHQSEAQTVLDHLSPQYAHSLERNGLFIAKLPESLLATPIVTKNSNNSDSDTIPASVRRSTRIANRTKSDLTMEQQATVLLMRKCGVLQQDQQPDQEAKEHFSGQFSEPMVPDTVINYREVFGLPLDEGTDSLSALAIHAEA